MLLGPVGESKNVSRQATIIGQMREIVSQPVEQGERFHVSFFDRHNGYIGSRALGRWGSQAISVRVREVMAVAIEWDAFGILLAHNHPSGRCRPSDRDIEATLHLGKIASALDVTLIDHLIFTQSEVYSMRAGGIL